MKQQVTLINQLCIKVRGAEKDKKKIHYQYTLHSLYQINQQLVIAITSFEAETLHQIDVSHYSYHKKLTAYQKQVLLDQQTQHIAMIAKERTYVDMSVHPLEKDICELESKYTNDSFNIDFLMAKKEKQRQLSDILFFDHIFPWYQQCSKSVTYAEYKAFEGLKQTFHYYLESKNHQCYLIFEEKQHVK